MFLKKIIMTVVCILRVPDKKCEWECEWEWEWEWEEEWKIKMRMSLTQGV